MNYILKSGLRTPARGATLAELAVVLPVFLLISLGVIQMGLVFHAKNTLNHATFMAARAGAVSGLNQVVIQNALAKGLVPLLINGRDQASYTEALGAAQGEVFSFSEIRILNPTREAFLDFGTPDISGVLQIPFERLHLRSPVPGDNSGVNIQDANLLKLQVIYGFPLVIPLAGPAIALVSSWYTTEPRYVELYKQGRMPVLATSVVRMQSTARNNPWVLSRADVDERLNRARNPLPPSDSGPGWMSGPHGRLAKGG